MSQSAPAVRRLAAGTVAAIALAGCADSNGSPASAVLAPTTTSASVQEFNSARHLFRTKQYYAANAAKPGGAGGGTGISYHGGSVLQNGTKVVSIYWGSSSSPVGYANLPAGTGTGASDGTLIGTFLRSLSSLTDVAAAKNYYNINHTYWGPGGSTLYITANDKLCRIKTTTKGKGF